MREIIRFAVAESGLGAFIVAMSQKGILALEFNAKPSAMVKTLHEQFPEADLLNDQAAMRDIAGEVCRAVEQPFAGTNLPLDLRKTTYDVTIFTTLRSVDEGDPSSTS